MSRRPRTGTVVVRAWLEPESTIRDIRARVLVIRGTAAETDEVGAAAGIDEVLTLVSDALALIAEPPV
ncbi:hypothetical protein [Terrabacter sp. RAF57]|uniref:hypothetical protein n=1 Tax=Terrabacter sp. RAF57 TaxID=3233063 RepID=UPI003F96ABC2